MTTALLPALTLELVVTPRWYSVGATFFEDAQDILRALASYEGDANKILADMQIGATGVRLILRVPAGQLTDAFETERGKIVDVLNALDAVSPRRARVTARRAKAAEEREAARKEAEGAEQLAKDAAIERGEARERALDEAESKAA